MVCKNFDGFGIISNTNSTPTDFLIDRVVKQNTDTRMSSISLNPNLSVMEKAEVFTEKLISDYYKKP